MELPAGREQIAVLLNELKAKYTSLCNEVQPIPGIGNTCYNIEEIFVEDQLEYFNNTTTAKLLGSSWQSLESYKDCFTHVHVRPTRRIIEGAPGFGKSTLTLKLASDWLRGGPDSPLRDVEILIILQLGQLHGVTSLCAAIKRLLLSNECPMSEADIESTLKEASSAAILFDDYDEYIERSDNAGSEIERIVTGEIFRKTDVTITAKRIPRGLPEWTKRVRLSGFDDWSRDQYVRKVVGSDGPASLEMTRHVFQNAILSDLMNVPIAFAIFVHMADRHVEYPAFRTVTHFFRYVVRRFRDFDAGQRDEEGENVTGSSEPDKVGHTKMNELAFEGLTERNSHAWNENEILEKLGQETYDHYVISGILIEENVFVDNVGSVSTNGPQRVVKFFHELFWQWFASIYVAEVASAANKVELWKCLQKMDPSEFQYVYRFACGHSPAAGSNIVNYLNGIRDCEKLSVLCVLEKSGTVDGVRVKIGQLFSGESQLWSSSNPLSQRSTIELMKIAARHDIKISNLDIVDCRPRVDRSERRLLMESGLSLPVLETLQCLGINESRLLSTGELVGILTFSSQCTGLKKLMFLGCKLPQAVPSVPAISTLRSRNVEVLCDPEGVGIRSDYQYLNLDNGQWEAIRERRVRKEREAKAKIVPESNNNANERPMEEDKEPEEGRSAKRCTIA